MILGDRTPPLTALAGCVAEPGKALAPRPLVHIVEELAALFCRARCGDRPHHRTLIHEPREQAEARASEMLAHVADQQRIAQVGLVGAIFVQRVFVRNAREFAGRRNRPTVGELLEHPREDRLDRSKDVVLGDEAHLEVELIEFAR